MDVDLAFVRRRLRTLREQLGLSQEQIAERGNLSKNFISALERGTKGFSMESFLRYIKGLGVSPQRVFVPEEDEGRRFETLSPEAQALVKSWQALSEADQRRLACGLNYLKAPEAEIRRLAQAHLDVLEDAVYARRVKKGNHLSSKASDAPAG
jgi:transcriptional regulator with XRE-family HTH domain